MFSIWWLLVALIIGYCVGAGTFALLQMASRESRKEELAGLTLDGPTNITLK